MLPPQLLILVDGHRAMSRLLLEPSFALLLEPRVSWGALGTCMNDNRQILMLSHCFDMSRLTRASLQDVIGSSRLRDLILDIGMTAHAKPIPATTVEEFSPGMAAGIRASSNWWTASCVPWRRPARHMRSFRAISFTPSAHIFAAERVRTVSPLKRLWFQHLESASARARLTSPSRARRSPRAKHSTIRS